MTESQEQPTNSDKKTADEIDAIIKIRKIMDALTPLQREQVLNWSRFRYQPPTSQGAGVQGS